ncbi:hypothetical protein ILUMI_20860 [Ignelater luminosus]|uniref:Xanthine dehydrogenase n=1 Tax=Ignelater luminosus TaxID=2038154 RepID=A0A8K0G4G9_IGNLU|nr:hypothetical protein ILUMI_20860 [Ignelater luminosus]
MQTFFTGYRQNIVNKDEVLISITIPFTKENQYFYAYKQARRRDDDTAIVNSAVNVEFENHSDIIKSIHLAFGGMAPTTVTAPKTSKLLTGKPWNRETLDLAYKSIIEDLPLPPSAPGGMIQFRRALTLSFFFRAFLAISEELQRTLPEIKIEEKDLSAITGFLDKIPKSSQYFQVLPTQEKINTIGQPILHASAFKQATGEAVYCDDIPPMINELYMGFVLSAKAHANILSIDPSEALQMEGVHAFFSAKDLPEDRNKIGKTDDEVVFVAKTVTSQGQILGVVIADDQAKAQKAARTVKVTYEELQPVIISIDDAINHKSYFTGFNNPKVIEKGDVDKVFETAPHIVEGESRNGAQEHFYLETQCTLVVPKEDDELEVVSSTQHPTAISTLIGHALNIPQNRVITKVKRVGGGFGGKEHRSAMVAIPAALAATRLKRPIRCMLDRDEDILMTGGRHPLYLKYKTAFDDDGRILGCEIYLYNNSGYANDLSEFVMERAVFHFENAYKIPNVRVVGYVCKTNLPSNMAMRGFGAPQGMLAAEFMIRKIAEYLKKDLIDICRLNLYREGDVTHYNQTLLYCPIERCWDECVASSNIRERRKEVEKYNTENRWKKRGISIVPVKYGVCFNPVHLNQAGALIHIYTDGSVLLTHGGAEMGQGLHTKMLQVASTVLGIPISKIYISETSTDKVPNTSPTAASFSSDINGMAVMNACEIINQRLEPYKKANPKGKWEEWISAAYFDRVSLSVTGFYKSPYSGYDWKTNSGDVYLYYTCGVACSEVEIDCLTGDHQVLRTDIVMDVGESMNPAIDVGQIEGAFMQGYGLYMLEELLYGPDGTIYTRGPGAYKLPGFNNIPLEFNVSLLKGAPNPRAIYSSKAVGEPPLFLASSVLFAVREAIKAARTDAGLSPTDFKLFAPVTCAKIRMACEDHLTAKLDEPNLGSFVPWNVVP